MARMLDTLKYTGNLDPLADPVDLRCGGSRLTVLAGGPAPRLVDPPPQEPPPTLPVVVVGGGPAGLAAAHELERRGIPVCVVERADAVGHSWRHHYASLRLNSGRRVSSLPGLPMGRELGRWVSRADFVTYLETYAARLDADLRLGVRVDRLDRDGDAWLLRTDHGDLRAGAVVVATGLNARAQVPSWAFGQERVVLATDYRDATPYRGRDVLVVGGGSTAHDLALDLVRGGARRVRLAVRTPPLLTPRSVLGLSTAVLSILVKHGPRVPSGLLDRASLALHRVFFPDAERLLGRPSAGLATALRERGHGLTVDTGILDAVRRGDVEVVPAVVDVRGDEVALADGSHVRPDDVLVAVGRRPDLVPLLGHLGVLGADGRPLVHGGATLPQAPGLHFLGYRLPAGQLPDLRFDAHALARSVAASSLRLPSAG